MELRARTKQRVIRILLAALLESDLTQEEMRELSANLFSNPSLIFELSDILSGVLQHFEKKSVTKGRNWREPGNDEELAYADLQRRRMSKSAVLRMMSKFSDVLMAQPIDPTATLRELVHLFWKSASPAERKEFTKALGAGRSKDLYLEGIMSRRQEAS